MTPRHARIALAGFALFAAAVTYNALYRQGPGSLPQRKAGGEESLPKAATGKSGDRTEKRPGKQSRRISSTGEEVAAASETVSSETIRAIQRELKERGFGTLEADGVMRPVTRAAIMAFEQDNGLPLTGEASEHLLRWVVLGSPASRQRADRVSAPSLQAETVIKQVQRWLADRGYRPGPADGRLNAETIAAIRLFETDQGLEPKGRISAEIFTRLQERVPGPTAQAGR